MATILKITESEELYMSNMAVGGMYLLVADSLASDEDSMATWLRNLWDRPAPFMDFDLRELPMKSRKAFVEAARSVQESLRMKYQDSPPDNAYSFHATNEFIKRIDRVVVDLPEYLDTDFEVEFIDFSDLWIEEETK